MYIATVALVVVAIARLVTRESARRDRSGRTVANRCSPGGSGGATLQAMSDTIVVRGAREHNLRNVDLDASP